MAIGLSAPSLRSIFDLTWHGSLCKVGVSKEAALRVVLLTNVVKGDVT